MTAVAVIGGGIAGLTAAYRLQEQGLTVALYEAADRTGGVIRSERVDGYLVEHGPNSIQSGTPLLDELIHRLSLEAARLEADPAAKRRYIVRAGRPVPLPASPPGLLTTDLFSLRGKLRLLREPFVRKAGPEQEESVASFVRRRLGPELLDYAVNPFLAGVYAGDPEQLSIRHAFPRLYEMEQQHGSLLLGGLKQARKSRDLPRRRIFSFRDGLQMLPAALAASLGGAVQLRSRITGIRQEGGQWHLTVQQKNRVQLHTAEGLLYAAPLHRLPSLAFKAGFDLSALREVPHPPISILALGFRREQVDHPLDGFGLLVPAAEREIRILGALFSSTLFPGRAPEGHVLLTTFIGGTRHPELALAPLETLLEVARRDLAVLLGASGAPAFVRHVRYEQSIPQYNLGYGRAKALMEQMEAHLPTFAMAGNYRRGISIGDTAASGDAAALRLARQLA